MECGEGGGLSGCFRNGQAVLLTAIEGSSEDAIAPCNARVLKSRGHALEVQLEGVGPEGVAIQHIRWTVEARPDERSFESMAHALSHWINVDDKSLLNQREAGLGFAEPETEEGFDSACEAHEMNDQQVEATKLLSSGSSVGLLHGPPGTGKTRTLVHGIHCLVKNGKRILASAPSNMAVDVLVERLAKCGLNVVRVGHPAKVQDHVLERTLDAQVEQHDGYGRVTGYRRQADEWQRQADRHVRNFGPAEREARKEARREARALRKEADELETFLAEEILRKADVVCATLVGCDDKRLRALNFDVAVVDEAGQALAPATLIPMRRSPRLFLCGDPCQLPPTVKTREAAALNQSLMEFLLEQGKTPVVMLEEQYRMHQAIMRSGSERFYQGKLVAHHSVGERSLEGLRPWVWVDTAGCGFEEKRSEEGGSVANVEEARFVVARASEWLVEHPNMSLGVVAPYAAQVEALQNEWSGIVAGNRDLEGADITIHTVDGFQGQERDGMIVSLTRCNERGEIGFLSDSRRIHVAQTRARMACMLVGDSVTLGQDDYLGWLIEWAQGSDCYDSAWSWMT